MTSQMEDGVSSIVFIGLVLVADLSAYSPAVLNEYMSAGHIELSIQRRAGLGIQKCTYSLMKNVHSWHVSYMGSVVCDQ